MVFRNLFNDKGRIYGIWEPEKSYIPQRILTLFLTCLGEGLVFVGIMGGLVGLQTIHLSTGLDAALILPGLILMIVGMVGMSAIPNTIYYMVMWWLTRDSYYINMYNKKT